MATPIMELEIDSTTRITAYYDDFPYSFEDLCGDDFGVQTLRIARNFNEISSKDEAREAIAEIVARFNYHTHDNYEELRERWIGWWLSQNGYAYEFLCLRGYSQGDWADVVIYTPMDNAEYLKHQRQALENWFRGDVYVIARENLETYVNTIDSDNTIERWEMADSIGGVMLEDSDELLAYAKDTWDLEPV